MALKIEFYIEGENGRGPIDLEASLARLRALLEQVDDAQNSTVSLRLSSVFSARQMKSGPDWDPQGALSAVWQSHEWVVYANDDDNPSTEELEERG